VDPRAGLDVCKNLASTDIRSQDRPARFKSLYRLSYPGPYTRKVIHIFARGIVIYSDKINQHNAHFLN
jgi:hypothetical protein